MHNFTQKDLIAYYYRECTSETYKAIESIINTDIKFQSAYTEIVLILQQLPALIMEPEERTQKDILKYAAKLKNQLHTL